MYESLYPWIKFDENPNDFFWAWWDINIPLNTNTEVIEYNQYSPWIKDIYKNTSWSCGLFASIWAVSDYTWYTFSEEEIYEIQKLAIDSYWLEVPWGMYLSKAIDCVRAYWNTKFPEDTLVSYRLTMWDQNYHEALDKLHSLVVGYKTSREYSLEANTWAITSEDFPKGGGHLVRNAENNNISTIRDNYKWIKPFNIYENEKIIPLAKNWVYFPSAYLFLYDEDNRLKKEKQKKIDEICRIIETDKANGAKRIQIYFALKAIGYSAKYIEYRIRKVYNMNITPEMEI